MSKKLIETVYGKRSKFEIYEVSKSFGGMEFIIYFERRSFMRISQAVVAFMLILNSIPSFSSGNVCRPIVQNCNSIKANDKNYKASNDYRLCRESYVRCLEGEREAARFAKEQKKHETRARIRDAICIADAIGGDVAAYAAGWQGEVVYKGTRAAADAISNGASSCPVKRK